MQKLFQSLIQWTPTGFGLGFTSHFLLSHEWTQAVISTFFTACTSLWVKFSSRFMETLEKKSEEWGEKSATWVGSQGDSLPGKLKGVGAKLRWRFSDFENRYLQSLVDNYCQVKTEGFQLFSSLNLEDVFIPLQIQVDATGDYSYSSAFSPSFNSREGQKIWAFLSQVHQVPAFRCLAVTAAAGYGKTTLLHHITLTYSKNNYGQHQAPKFIPFLLPLKTVYSQVIVENQPTLIEVIAQNVKNLPALYSLAIPPKWIENKLKAGSLLILFDGLDEVAKLEDRQKVSRWLNQQMKLHRKTPFIITSRPHGFETKLFDEVGTRLTVLPLNTQQIRDFIYRWYKHTEIRYNANRKTPKILADAKEKAANLINRIICNRAITKMAENPLLITMISLVHYHRNTLPINRVELYRRICDLLLGDRREAKNIKIPLTVNQYQSVLQILALNLMQANRREFSLEAGKNFIRESLEKAAGNSLTPEEFIRDVKEISGLIVGDTEKYEFAHLSLQEYLAATQIKESQQESILLANFDKSWWQETIRLYAAQSDVTELIKRGLSQPNIPCLTLAYDCLLEGKSVELATRQQLEDILERGLEAEDVAIAKVAAQVHLSRRLNNLALIDEKKEIDLDYISCAEYQLFLNQEKENPSRCFSLGNAKKPITGISFVDASRFCGWLTVNSPVSPDDKLLYQFRLPTGEEINEYSARENRHLLAWIKEEDAEGNSLRVVREVVQLPTQYVKLFSDLAAGNWREADEETFRVMLKVANREKEGYLDVESIEKFPCEDLRIIDQLWVQFSGGRFGFSVQKQIWESVGGNPKNQYNEEVYRKFAQKNGWYAMDKYIYLRDRLIGLIEAPKGHLPSISSYSIHDTHIRSKSKKQLRSITALDLLSRKDL